MIFADFVVVTSETAVAASVAARLLARYLNRYSLSSTRTFDSLRNGPKSTSFGSVEHELLPIGEFFTRESVAFR